MYPAAFALSLFLGWTVPTVSVSASSRSEEKTTSKRGRMPSLSNIKLNRTDFILYSIGKKKSCFCQSLPSVTVRQMLLACTSCKVYPTCAPCTLPTSAFGFCFPYGHSSQCCNCLLTPIGYMHVGWLLRHHFLLDISYLTPLSSC